MHKQSSSSHRSGHRVSSAATSTSVLPFIRMPNMLARSKRRLLDDEFPPAQPHESPLEMEDPHSFAFAFAYDRSTAARGERPGKRSRAATHSPPPVPPSTPQPIRRTRLQTAKRQLARYVARRRQELRERYRLTPTPAGHSSPCTPHIQHRAADPLTAMHHAPCKRHGGNCTRASPPPEKAQSGLRKLIDTFRDKAGSPPNKLKKRPMSELVISTEQLDAAAAYAQAKRPRSFEASRRQNSWAFTRVDTTDSDKSLLARWRHFIASKLSGSRQSEEPREEDIISPLPPLCQCPEAVAFRRHFRVHHHAQGTHRPSQRHPTEVCFVAPRCPSPVLLSNTQAFSTVHWDDGYQRDPNRAYADTSSEADGFGDQYLSPPGDGEHLAAAAGSRHPQPTLHTLVEIGSDDDDFDSVWTDIDDEEVDRSHLEAVAQAAERGQAPLTGPNGLLQANAASASLSRGDSLAGIARGERLACHHLAGPELATPGTSTRARAGSSVGELSDVDSLDAWDINLEGETMGSDLWTTEEPVPITATEAEILALLGVSPESPVVAENDGMISVSRQPSRRTPSPAADEISVLSNMESVPDLTSSSSSMSSATFASWDRDNPNFARPRPENPGAGPAPREEREPVAEAVEAEGRDDPAPDQGPDIPAPNPAPAQPPRLRFQEAAAAGFRSINRILARHGPQHLA